MQEEVGDGGSGEQHVSQLHVSAVRGCVFRCARTPLMQQLLHVAANEVVQIRSFVLKLHQTG